MRLIHITPRKYVIQDIQANSFIKSCHFLRKHHFISVCHTPSSRWKRTIFMMTEKETVLTPGGESFIKRNGGDALRRVFQLRESVSSFYTNKNEIRIV